MAEDQRLRMTDDVPQTVIEDGAVAGGPAGEAVVDYRDIDISPGNEPPGAQTGAEAVDGTPLSQDIVADAEAIITGDPLVDDTGILVDGDDVTEGDGRLRADVYDYEMDAGDVPPGEGVE